MCHIRVHGGDNILALSRHLLIWLQWVAEERRLMESSAEDRDESVAEATALIREGAGAAAPDVDTSQAGERSSAADEALVWGLAFRRARGVGKATGGANSSQIVASLSFSAHSSIGTLGAVSWLLYRVGTKLGGVWQC